MREILLSEVGMLDRGKSNPNFSKRKIVFLPYYFLICFKGLLEIKLSVKSVLENCNTLRAWEKREEKKYKGEKTKNPSRMPRSFSYIRWG